MGAMGAPHGKKALPGSNSNADDVPGDLGRALRICERRWPILTLTDLVYALATALLLDNRHSWIPSAYHVASLPPGYRIASGWDALTSMADRPAA